MEYSTSWLKTKNIMAKGYGIIYTCFEMTKTNALLLFIYFKDSNTENAMWVRLAGRIREDGNSLYFDMTLGWWSGQFELLNMMKLLCCFPLNFSVFINRGKKKTLNTNFQKQNTFVTGKDKHSLLFQIKYNDIFFEFSYIHACTG